MTRKSRPFGIKKKDPPQGQNDHEEADEEIPHTPAGHAQPQGMNTPVAHSGMVTVYRYDVPPGPAADSIIASLHATNTATLPFRGAYTGRQRPAKASLPSMNQASTTTPKPRPVIRATGAIRGGKHGEKSQPQQRPAPEAAGPAAGLATTAPAKRKYEVTMRCANCKLDTHWLVRCIGPVDSHGYIPGCPFCGELGHIWEQCSSCDGSPEALAEMFLFRRQFRPQFECTLAPPEHALAQPGQIYEKVMPFSTEFALEFQRQNPNYWKTYQYQRYAKDDKPLGIDGRSFFGLPNLDNNRLRVPLSSLPKVEATRERWNKKAKKPEATDNAADEDTEGDTNMDDNPLGGGTGVTATSNKRGKTFAISRPQSKRSTHPPCENCGKNHAPPCRARATCGGCGKPGHKRFECPHYRTTCVCKDNPRHVVRDCPVKCSSEHCNDNTEHIAVECASRCNSCGEPGHAAIECNSFTGICGCGAKDHASGQHSEVTGQDNLWCVHKDCLRFFCWVHCQDCALEHRGEACNSTVETILNGNGTDRYKMVSCKRRHDAVMFGYDCRQCSELLKR